MSVAETETQSGSASAGKPIAATVRWWLSMLTALAAWPIHNVSVLPILLLGGIYFRQLWRSDLHGAAAAGGAALLYGIGFYALFGRAFMGLLAVRYLLGRPIAIVAVLSVTLCTAMVLTVASIMEGFLKATREAMHGAKGDLIITGDFRGLPFYEEFARRAVEDHPSLRDPVTGRGAVARASPLMYTLGLATVPMGGTDRISRVQVVGIRREDVLANPRFLEGLIDPTNPEPTPRVRLTAAGLDALRKQGLPDEVLRQLEPLRNRPWVQEDIEFLARYPTVLSGRPDPAALAAAEHRQAGLPDSPFLGLLAPELAQKHGPAILTAMEPDPVQELPVSNDPRTFGLLGPRRVALPRLGVRHISFLGTGEDSQPIRRANEGGGFLVGKEMVSHRDASGKLHPVLDRSRPLRLTVIPPGEAANMEIQNLSTRLFEFEGFHRTGVYEQDKETVYVDFDYLQEMMLMKADPEAGRAAYCNAIQIDLAPGTQLERGRQIVASAWRSMVDEIAAEQLRLQQLSAAGTPADKLPKPTVGPSFPLRWRKPIFRDLGWGRSESVIFDDIEAGRYLRGQAELAAAVPAGATELPTRGLTGLSVGDRVVVVGGLSNKTSPPELHTLTAVEGSRVRLDRPLEHARPVGSPVSGGMIFAVGSAGPVEARTWEENMRTFLLAVQKEKVMMLVLFGIISLVAVLLVLSIFIQIVKEKTRDIGIIKSVGASRGQIAGVFLLYALCIGTVGSALGVGLGCLTVYHINDIHDVVAGLTGVIIWDPSVYVLPRIPEYVDPLDAAWVAGIGLVASLTAALVPASLAARLPPVRALSYE